MFESNKLALVILDGWGHAASDRLVDSAIEQAKTPFMDRLYANYPNADLTTYGEEVGLPGGQMGNSEVGHMNLGAGRVVYQELLRINNALKSGDLAKNEVLGDAIEKAKENEKPFHLLGLLSDGGVHSHINHLIGLCHILNESGLEKVYLHLILDGRDTSPTGGIDYVKQLQASIKDTNIQIATIIGRYYAMDRDKRWERIKLAYDLLVKGEGSAATDPIRAIQDSYDAGKTDEFVLPIVMTDDRAKAIATLKEEDVLLCFNFRTDRPRQISTVLTQADMPEHEMKTLAIHYYTMTRYDDDFKNIGVLFDKDNIPQTLGEVLAAAGKTQIRIAETEKYPHVTFFFNGGREEAFEGEERIMIPSPKVATYDLQPEMSALPLTDAILPHFEAGKVNFICLNFANPDMVGHTGDFDAAVKAVETVDACLERIVTTGLKSDYAFLIIADHGNADVMRKPDGKPHTAHTTNPVPLILVANDLGAQKIRGGKLGDLAPTILQMMGLAVPDLMTGDNLLKV